ncbi:MAG: biotin/lipoate A/B protein ligase family protein [Coprothermobacterota bacterium]|nr:biotin/lipoate A/B protein ligase family protein [Coprothermobacterota bacterium]
MHDGIRDPFLHLAVEEAALRGVNDGSSPPTLRLRRSDPSVWIGVYQAPEEEVDLAFCHKQKIPVIRRQNPGGAVYQDEGSFCYSLFFPKEELFSRLGLHDSMDLYPLMGRAVAATCGEYGVEALASPVNDVVIGGRKVYGSAQVEFYSAFVHSGAFLVSTDREAMQRALKPSALKFADKGFTTVRERVINLSEAAGRSIPVEEVMERLTAQIARILGIELAPAHLLPAEWELAAELNRDKYSRKEWTFRNQPAFTTVLATKARSGVITLEARMEGGVIAEARVRGDFLLPDQGEMDRVLERMAQQPLEAARRSVQSSALPEDLKDGLEKLLGEMGSSATLTVGSEASGH